MAFSEVLDLSSHVLASSFNSVVYDLSGIVVHIGPSMSTGHCVAYARHSHSWFRLDDGSMPQQCTLQQVLGQQVYVAFFTRRKVRACCSK